jgi:hypothetical protein
MVQRLRFVMARRELYKTNNETLDGELREEEVFHNSSRTPDAETLIVTSA